MKQPKKKTPGQKSGSAKKSSTLKPKSGDDPILVKPTSGDEPILVKPTDSGDDPILPKPTGNQKTGAKPAKKKKKTPIRIRPTKDDSLQVIFDTPDFMGWTLVIIDGVTTIIIPKGAAWKVKHDPASGRLFLEGPGKA